MVRISGYGEVLAVNPVSVAPEVAGRIIQVHPDLEVGEIVAGGELLFEIDPVTYKAAYAEAKATVEKWQNSIRILEKKYALDKKRLKTLSRTRQLTLAEYQRLKKLFEKDQVGARSRVDDAEQAYNAAMDQEDRMAQALALYPLQINEAKSSLAASEAVLMLSEANLKRCRITAPFDARIKEVSLEQGQYVAPGNPVITLADDSILEVRVPIDSRDARRWLEFDGQPNQNNSAWFSNLEPVTCLIRWTEDTAGHSWEGVLHRVIKLDQNTRTLHLAVRIPAKRAISKNGRALPLVEGMFCAVEIPGRTLQNIFKIPRWAVSFENMVYLSDEHRLKTVPVKVDRIQGETALVSSGLNKGDLVITTRLTNPLENSLLTFSAPSHANCPGNGNCSKEAL